jgi:two-component system OmpR family response regulator/two-component system alkaline phosphatase synthesis response regulator PhoP
MLSFLGILLRESGFEVLLANSATYGLKRAEADRPDLVLLDIMMPDVDGWETCRRLRELGDMPIVFVTALRDAKNRERGLILGDDYIVKPFDPRELINRVRTHIERWLSKNQPPSGGVLTP